MATEEVTIVLKGEFKNKEAILSALKQVDKGVKSVEEQTKKASASTNNLTKTLSKLAKIAGIAILTKKFVSLGKSSLAAAGRMEQLDVAFTTMLGSAEKAKDLMQEMIKFAKTTPFELEGIAAATRQLLAYGVEQENIIPRLRLLGDLAAGFGAPLGQVAKAFLDVKAAGRLMGKDLIQFQTIGINLQEKLAETFNKTVPQIKKLQAQGEISFAMVEQAIEGMAGKGGEFFGLMEKQSKTFLGTLSNMSDNFFSLKVAIGNALLPVAKQFVNFLSPALDKLAASIDKNKDKIVAFTQGIAKGFVLIGKALKPAVDFLFLFTKGLIFLIKQPVIKFLGLMNLSLLAIVGSLRLLRIVSPFGWLVTAISAVIAAIGYLSSKFSGFSAEWQTAFLEIQKTFKKFEADFITVISTILNGLAKLEKIPGFGWTKNLADDVNDMRTNVEDDIDAINDKILTLQSGGSIAAVEQEQPAAIEEAEGVEEEAEAAVSDKVAKQEEENEALLKLHEDFLAGKFDLETLEDERLAIKAEEDLAALNERYLVEEELLGQDEEAKLQLKKKYELEKVKLEKAREKQQKFFSKQSLDGARTASGQLVALENSKHKELAAIGKAAAVFNITVDTARGAMAAYSALAGIPYVGPALGIVAAAAVTAYGAEQIGAASGASFAVGASEIPQDMTAQIHQGEMIIPNTFAQSIRSGELTLGGQSDDVAGNDIGEAGVQIINNFDGATFVGIDDEMVIQISNRMGDLISEDLIDPLPTRSA